MALIELIPATTVFYATHVNKTCFGDIFDNSPDRYSWIVKVNHLGDCIEHGDWLIMFEVLTAWKHDPE